MRYLLTLLLLTVSALAQPLTSHDPAFLQSTSPLRKGLVGYWSLEETSGTRYDRSSSGNHLTSNNSVGQAAGKVANCATFVRTSSQLLSKTGNSSFPTNSVTIASWVKLTTFPANATYPALACKWGAVTNRQYSLYLDGDADRFAFTVATNTAGGTHTVVATTFGLPSTNSWIFVAAWYNAASSTINIKVNNGTTDTSASVNPVTISTADFELGRQLTYYLDGNLDEVGLWNRVLTSTELTSLYNSGRGRRFPFVNSP